MDISSHCPVRKMSSFLPFNVGSINTLSEVIVKCLQILWNKKHLKNSTVRSWVWLYWYDFTSAYSKHKIGILTPEGFLIGKLSFLALVLVFGTQLSTTRTVVEVRSTKPLFSKLLTKNKCFSRIFIIGHKKMVTRLRHKMDAVAKADTLLHFTLL